MKYKSSKRKRTTTFPDGSKIIETAGGIEIVEARTRYRVRRVAKAVKPKRHNKSIKARLKRKR